MANIYLYKFNNYYNRQVKHLSELTPSAIEELGGELVYSKDAISFKWNDGVSNELILNYDIEKAFSGDYCLVEDINNSNSVWFIMEASRTRTGQCRLILYRDLINTYYDDIINAPCFIEKATLTKNNDLIFNSENMSFNQIKKSESLLYDSSTCAWIVGYLADDAGTITDRFTTVYDDVATISGNHDEWDYARFTASNPLKVLADDWSAHFFTRYTKDYNTHPYHKWTINSGDSISAKSVTETQALQTYVNCGKNKPSEVIKKAWFNKESIKGYLRTAVSIPASGDITLAYIKAYDGARIKFDDGTYDITVVKSTNVQNYEVNNVKDNDAADQGYYQYMNGVFENQGLSIHKYLSHNTPFGYNVNVENYYIVMTKVAVAGTYEYTIPNTTRRAIDAPYKIFAIPYTTCLNSAEIQKGGNSFKVDKDIALAWAMSIAKTAGAQLYDLQLLPFTFIISEYITGRITPEDGEVIIQDDGYGSNGIDYVYLRDSSNNIVSLCYFAKAANFTRTIVRLKTDNNIVSTGFDISDLGDLEFKVANECDTYRICSPNYASVFEIKATQNGGLKGFKADCTYKPYQPFIYIYPEFNRLYGKEFKDNRGLVLSGDFSLPIINNAWTQYQIQNKFQENIFDRQIQNMYVNNAIANQNAVWQAAAGTVSGAASGAMTGALTAGGPGAIAGAAIGGITAGVGGAMDIANQKKLQAETIDYTRDLYGYQLGNIKALPNTLAKVGSITATNKLWAFVEYYTATDTEKEALRNKLKYNGMSVGVIDKMSNYIYEEPTYIKGKIIRLENTDIDYHEMNIIAEEINKGVFI